MNLSYCEDTKVDVYVPLILSEELEELINLRQVEHCLQGLPRTAGTNAPRQEEHGTEHQLHPAWRHRRHPHQPNGHRGRNQRSTRLLSRLLSGQPLGLGTGRLAGFRHRNVRYMENMARLPELGQHTATDVSKGVPLGE